MLNYQRVGGWYSLVTTAIISFKPWPYCGWKKSCTCWTLLGTMKHYINNGIITGSDKLSTNIHQLAQDFFQVPVRPAFFQRAALGCGCNTMEVFVQHQCRVAARQQCCINLRRKPSKGDSVLLRSLGRTRASILQIKGTILTGKPWGFKNRKNWEQLLQVFFIKRGHRITQQPIHGSRA